MREQKMPAATSVECDRPVVVAGEDAAASFTGWCLSLDGVGLERLTEGLELVDHV